VKFLEKKSGSKWFEFGLNRLEFGLNFIGVEDGNLCGDGLDAAFLGEKSRFDGLMAPELLTQRAH